MGSLEESINLLNAEASYDSSQYADALDKGDGGAASQWLTALTLTSEALRNAHNALLAKNGGKGGFYEVSSPS